MVAKSSLRGNDTNIFPFDFSSALNMDLRIIYFVAQLICVTAYGPFYGNRDLLCNRGTQFACYCSTVTWRRFNRTDAPSCSQLFPSFDAAVLELETCDVRLEDNPFGNVVGQRHDDDTSATTFERYLKRTLATLIKRKCQESDQCSKIPTDLGEERIIFTSYQCSKDIRTSRLWILIGGADDESTPIEETQFADGVSLARILNSATILPQLNSHFLARRSRILNVNHSRLENNSGKDSKRVIQVQAIEPTRVRGESSNRVEYEENSDKISVTDSSDHGVTEATPSSGWVAILVGCFFVAYFLVVWLLALIFCFRKRREIKEKNQRLRNETKSVDRPDKKEYQQVESGRKEKFIARIDDSDYDN